MRNRGMPYILAAVVWLCGGASVSLAGECPNPDAIGTSRVIEVATPEGARPVSLKSGRHIKLRRKELILTIDDGPHPEYTPVILKTLEEHCIKATFFMVGEMASQSPELVREVYRRGHTIATHTWGHPLSLPRMKRAVAISEIERGIEAISYALSKEPGVPAPAPFFRFPGLNESRGLISYLNKKGISSVTVDIDPRDWSHKDADKLYHTTLRKIRRGGRGVLLLHDIKSATAQMLPRLLATLKTQGYSFVHMTPAAPDRPPMLMAEARMTPTLPVQVSFAQIGLRPSILTDDALLSDIEPEPENDPVTFTPFAGALQNPI